MTQEHEKENATASDTEKTDAPTTKTALNPKKKYKNIRNDKAAIEQFEKRVANVKIKAEKGDQNALEALRITELLQEPNIPGIFRLIYVFGRDVINKQAEDAAKAYEEAKQRGPEAYQPSEYGTLVATRKGQARTPGGILFYMVRELCEKTGINMESLLIPQVPTLQLRGPVGYKTATDIAEKASAEQQAAKEAKEAKEKQDKLSEKASPAPTETKPAQAEVAQTKPEPAVANPAKPPRDENKGDKPGRAKIVITGRLDGKPKANPQNLAGILELTVNTEMNQALPKGLPNLGSMKAVIWVTEKQFKKASEGATPETRFLIEGEPMPAVGADFKPFLRVVCTRFSNLDAEVAARKAQAENPA